MNAPTAPAGHIKLYGDEGVVEAVVRAFPTDSLPLAAFRTDAPSGRRMNDDEECDPLLLEHAPAVGDRQHPQHLGAQREGAAGGFCREVVCREMASWRPVSMRLVLRVRW
jgi:hypothetical protein